VIYAATVSAQSPRRLTIDDVIALQDIRQVTVSPDGQWLAMVIKRMGGPVTDADGDAFTDVWLVARDGRVKRNLTAAAGKDTRWWSPQWSPDGQRLALLSSTRQDNTTPYVWTLHSGSLTRITDGDVDGRAEIDATWPKRSFAWVDSVTLLCPILPVGLHPGAYGASDTYLQRAAPREWAKALTGSEPAVSVLQSGQDAASSERPQGRLVEIDVRSKKVRLVVTGNFWQVLLSPNRKYAALVADMGRIQPPRDRRLPDWPGLLMYRASQLALVRLDSATPARWVQGVVDPAITGGGDPIAHTWSPDGNTFAVVAKRNPAQSHASTVYLVSAQSGAARAVTDTTLDVSATAWAGNGTLLAYATGSDTARHDWWGVGDHTWRITGSLSDVPDVLTSTPDTNVMIGTAAGRLLAIDVHSLRTERLGHDSIQFDGLAWPQGSIAIGGRPNDLLAETTRGAIYRVSSTGDRTQFTVALIARPSVEANLVAVDPAHHLTVFTAVERTGTFLWTGDGNSARFTEDIAVNEQLRNIADPKRVLVNYVGVDGDSLKGLLLLPVDYKPGTRYPLITFVYGGVTVSDTSWDFVNKNNVSTLNLSLLPAHGYALLLPSIPLGPPGVASDPMLDMSKGVISAVDAVIRMGVADPARLGVMGHSYGGYSAYSLLVYTHRFHAAVAIAGLSDLASFYGTIDARSRYTDFGYEIDVQPGWAEAGVLRMRDTPWTNLWRYLRNSPYFFADRVETPLMIVQGDADAVAMQQGEEFFMALYRMGKRATFVRYWGDDHDITQSPANARDLWGRIFAWFDDELHVEHHSMAVGGP
jgi:dipeptidyl aminopeptidase/acylaminoacyl peptidase